MTERILLIGGNGFIGSHLIDELLDEGYPITVLDKRHELYRKPNQNVRYYIGNYNDSNILNQALAHSDIVIHLAHIGTPISSAMNTEREILNNILAFSMLLEKVKTSNIQKFIFLSSGGAVYGIPDCLPVDESYKGWPISPYGISKLTMEHFLHMFSHFTMVPYIILRPSNPFGPRQNFMGKQGIIPVAIYHALTNNPLKIWGNGNAVKDYFFINDLTRVVVDILKINKINEVFNIGSGKGISIRSLVDTIQKVLKIHIQLIFEPQYKEDVTEVVLSCRHLHEATGWEPKINLEKGIKFTSAWIENELSKKKYRQ
jgi:UDP-glucose 4-epimerase